MNEINDTKSNKLNHCGWCGAPTDMEKVLLPSTPILVEMEQKIDLIGRDEVWGENSDWSELHLDPDIEAELLIYDEMMEKVSLNHICKYCLDEDQKLYDKYYGGIEEEGNEDIYWE